MKLKIILLQRLKKEELMGKKLSKHLFFDYFDKFLIVVLVRSGSVSIASFATVIGIPVGIASASLNLTFLLCTGLIKNY